jgi:DNA mismatch repair protein MutL
VKQYVKENSDKKLEEVVQRAEQNESVSEPHMPELKCEASVSAEREHINSSAPKIAEPAPRSVNQEEVQESKPLTHRIIGEAFNSYVIVERGDTMLLIDKHAAHERIIFEELRAAMKNSAPTSQMLMLPLEIMMTSDEIQTLDTYREEIEAIGFEFTEGRYSVSVLAIPEGVSTDAVSDMLVVMAERIKSGTGTAGLTRDIVFEKALYQASCKAAIKAGREYVGEHIKWIVDKLMALPDITVCPHGRPVAMELTKKNLDRQFDRT